MKYWLIKSEGDCYSIDDFRKDGSTDWTGIRNYQARNFMRDGMSPGDLALFYHSSGTKESPTGVYGIAKVASKAYPDATAEDPKDEHYDPGREWVAVRMKFVEKFLKPVLLTEIKRDPELRHMQVAQQGIRLSVMPVTEKHFKKIRSMGQ